MRVAILCITHPNIASTLLANATALLGDIPPPLDKLEIPLTHNIAPFIKGARHLCQSLDEGLGVLILTDLVGATPSNTAAAMYQAQRIEIVSGLNLAMLAKLVTYRDLPLTELIEKIIAGGHDSIMRYPF